MHQTQTPQASPISFSAFTPAQRLNAVRSELRTFFDSSSLSYITADHARAVAKMLGFAPGNWLGSVFAEGFRAVGIARSNQPSRKGGLIRTWVPA